LEPEPEAFEDDFIECGGWWCCFAAFGNVDGVFDKDRDAFGGDRETDIFCSGGGLSGVEADEFSGNINERSAGVSRIDGGIGLQERVVVGFADGEAAVEGTEDAGADAAFVADGIADGDDGLAEEVGGDVVDVQGREWCGGFDFD
jgi:hypothetical protein